MPILGAYRRCQRATEQYYDNPDNHQRRPQPRRHPHLRRLRDRAAFGDALLRSALQLAAGGGYDPAADVNQDGRITSLDALMILQTAAGGNIEI